MIAASVDEAAAADAQILQPGLGWVPLWRSASYPIEAHAAWIAKRDKVPLDKVPNSYIAYMLRGGDVLGDFVTRCRELGRAPIASLRLNDIQVLGDLEGHDGSAAWVSRFYYDHPEYRLDPESADPRMRAQNWAIPEVREAKLRFLEEMIEGYDVAGVELDFMRTEIFFRAADTSSAERRRLMTQFVADVRRALDRKAKGALALCLRVPAVIDFHDAIGLDVESLAAAGADVFTLSSSFFTSQRADIEAFRAAAPAAQLFLEMTHASAGIHEPREPHDPGHTRTTDVQFLSTAAEARHRGADGTALFNFAYFRTQNSVDPSVGREPPFHLLPTLAEPDKIGPGPRCWFLAQGWGRGPETRDDWLPRWVSTGHPLTLSLYAEPARRVGLLRLRGQPGLSGRRPRVSLNGVALASVEARERQPRGPGEGPEDEYLFFACPAGLVVAGRNQVQLADPQEHLYVNECDLLFPAG